ncbi:MAG: NUDIX domain-containing protein [Planctomycetes bacterium]|nr:NUDIX domain-containing protein [Planctomycetota bacterium]
MNAHVLELLNRYEAYDARERHHFRRMIKLAQDAADPFSRKLFEPGHFTASAFIVSPDARSLLLILHSKLHRWLQPGGHIDAADTNILEAARRETREETGVVDMDAVPLNRVQLFDLDIHPIPANPKKDEPAHEHFDLRFLFRAKTTELVAADDAHDARWVDLRQITQEFTDASVMRALEKLRRLRL